MKVGKTLTLLVMVITAITILPVFGCGGESEEVSPARLTRIEMLQKVPVYSEDFQFWDVAALRDDPDLKEMYEIWYGRKVDFLEERYGLATEKIEYLAEGARMSL